MKRMKMIKGVMPLTALIYFTSGCALAQDEYEYISVPSPAQIADLQDDDLDGVINARDKCPTTPFGSEIDNFGCESQVENSEQLELKVLFANNSSDINPAFIREIKNMVQFLGDYPATSIEIQGHASLVGSESHNQILSEERANKVREIMIRQGIQPERVNIIGFGDKVRENEGESQLSHALNRRVTAKVVGYNSEILKEWTIFTSRKS